MRKLYLQIYLALLTVLLGFFLLAAIAWVLMPRDADDRRDLRGLSDILAQLLPAADRPAADQQAALQRLAKQFPVHLTLRAGDGALVAHVGDALPAPSLVQLESGRARVRGVGPMFVFKLPDGRTLSARWPHQRWPVRALLTLALVAALLAIAAYPVARRITRRLERLRIQVEALGSGNLAARVDVAGKDEVAELAQSFNRAAGRIEKLVDAQRATLASASHELRSPLARIRLAVELLAGDSHLEARAQLVRDIAELDDLIDELLMASRLDGAGVSEQREQVDLLALLAEEAIRVSAAVEGAPAQVRGDPRMLRRMLRNVLDNARRYGGGSAIEARVIPMGHDRVQVAVCDRGPGIPESEREKVFEPFYRAKQTQEIGESQSGGIGLGLALVRRIARHHGGDASCVAREGGGTCFQIDLAVGLGSLLRVSAPLSIGGLNAGSR